MLRSDKNQVSAIRELRMASRKQAHAQLVRALRTMMATARADREPQYRAAAEKVVALRQLYLVDGVPDWTGTKHPEYRAAIQQAYREAGVPSDSDDTVQASLRYHVGNVVREVAPQAELEALGLLKEGPAARVRRQASTRPRKTTTAPEVTPMPNILSEALEDPVGLVVHAIRAIEAAKNLKPRGPEGDTIRFLLKSLWAEVDALAELVDQNNDGAV